MSNVNVDGIVTPDEDSRMEPDIYLAAMASSISNGIGRRLAYQEETAGVKATLYSGAGWRFDGQEVIVPVTVTDSYGDFVDNADLAGGVATIQRSGLYFLYTDITPYQTPEKEYAINYALMVNGEQYQSVIATTSKLHWKTTNMSNVAPLTEGDKVWIQISIGGGDDTNGTELLLRYARLSAVMLYGTEPDFEA